MSFHEGFPPTLDPMLPWYYPGGLSLDLRYDGRPRRVTPTSFLVVLQLLGRKETSVDPKVRGVMSTHYNILYCLHKLYTRRRT